MKIFKYEVIIFSIVLGISIVVLFYTLRAALINDNESLTKQIDEKKSKVAAIEHDKIPSLEAEMFRYRDRSYLESKLASQQSNLQRHANNQVVEVKIESMDQDRVSQQR